jgi:hypothetical protein
MAAMKANRFWWTRQNKAIGQDCRKTPDCWLPRNHQGEWSPPPEIWREVVASAKEAMTSTPTSAPNAMRRTRVLILINARALLRASALTCAPRCEAEQGVEF